jgi:hypothetical protein
LRVFPLGLLLLVLGATGLTMLVALKTLVFHPDLFVLWYSIMAEPFAALWVLPEQSGWLSIGVINLAASFAHPAWPNRVTAILTLLAFAGWLFWGMAISCSHV